ncbi:MAG: hypothetical protein IIB11_08280 [Chloroflexi bacterium]|nr:hypothetical protein [Chloroflexota bacterium]
MRRPIQRSAELEKEGIDAEVVDLLSLSPMDEETVLTSVKKTRRVVITDEDYPRCSVAADLSALVAEEAFDYLAAPPERVTPPHTPIPYSLALERRYPPTKEKILAAVKSVLE